MSGYRLPLGGLVARDSPLRFRYDEREYQGYAGDTLASALLASGERVFARSFKFRRPRGLVAAGVEEPNALLEVDDGWGPTPLVRATVAELREGLRARSGRGWPSVRIDLGRVLDWCGALFPAGFYHKTFLWPSWRWYEGPIRRLAGRGRAPEAADDARYDWRNLHCDVLVVGAGPAGIAAADAASASGARVVLVEQDFRIGGTLLWQGGMLDGSDGPAWVDRAADGLRARTEVRVLRRTTAFGYYDHDCVLLVQRLPRRADGRGPRERLWQVRARRVVLATGALEQPLVFQGNDLPGVMLAGAVQQYANRYAVAAGRRVVVATNNDGAYRVALDLARVGITVASIVDTRSAVSERLLDTLRGTGIPVLAGHAIDAARGRGGVSRVELVRLQQGARAGPGGSIACDVVASSAGWAPTVHLWSQARGSLAWHEALQAFVPSDANGAALRAAGAAAGLVSLGDALESGRDAGAAVAAELGFEPVATPSPRVVAPTAHEPVGAIRSTPDAPGSRRFIDLHHDVTTDDLALAVRENFVSVEHAKRYTAAGMAPDQGKTSSLNTLIALAQATGREPSAVGTTTFRPPYTPVSLGALAGRELGGRYKPLRQLPTHASQVALGAAFDEFGGWWRPIAYPRTGESPAQAIEREVRAVRCGAGLLDASPLGKIEVRGPDAAVFVDRLYPQSMRKLAVGRVRYGLMLNEQGAVFDDGTVARLAHDHFLLSTTSGGVSRVLAFIEECRQTAWPELRVAVTPVTANWGTLMLCGPNARTILAALGGDIELANESFPHLSVRTGQVAGCRSRVCRVSFTGELGYEISVPSADTEGLWQRTMSVGSGLGLLPFGVESLLMLRLEKGYLHVGMDTDGTTTPDDLGYGEAARRRTGTFIGRRALSRPANVDPQRLQLVGLRADPDALLVVGAHLRLPGMRVGSDGFITSAGYSPALDRRVALALLRGGRARRGEVVAVHDGDRRAEATVVETAFFDPKGDRAHG